MEKVLVERKLLEEATENLRDFVAESGGCDHDVNICACDTITLIAGFDHALGRHKEKPDPYGCGACADEHPELGI